ncbi:MULTISPECIES: hypothetical protein [unclassified Nonomuraea]|uniref:hypothetical protein n=1 Tax=unclassified Nonomuraea TaxID=2593643 RepID=UPI0035C16B02
MEYVVQVEIEPALGAPELDALQCHGAGALLSDGLDGVEHLDGPDGIDIDLYGFRVTTHPKGALLGVVVETSTLEIAETGVRRLVESVLERSELLASWRVLRSEVDLNEEAFRAGLKAADAEPVEQPVAPDEGERSRLRFRQERLAGMRASLISGAARMQAFGLEHFGYRPDGPDRGVASRESATLAAGALMAATDILIDHVLDDAETLAAEESTVADDPGVMALHGLPPQYALRYDAAFARKFAVATISVTGRLADDTWRHPACVAEELALRLLIEEAKAVLELYELMDSDEAESIYDFFTDHAFDDVDHEMLYTPELDGIDEHPEAAFLRIAPMGFASWFVPFDRQRRVHPYLEEPESSPSANAS